MTLADHPRLFAGTSELFRLRHAPETPAMQAAHKALMKNARAWLRSSEFTGSGAGVDPSGLGKARESIDRIITLTAACCKTGDDGFRMGALDYIRALDEMKSVEYREENERQGFWLSDGEECAGIAIVYDWLYDELGEDGREMLREICRRRLFSLALAKCREGGEWWFGLRFSNWNAVCAGGLGMLCLSMYEECDEARQLLPRVEETLAEFMVPLEETNGGWPEGLGYWNYGMAYAFEYLLSWERSTGKVHPLMERPATKRTLSFPLDFYPHNMPAGFGDNNGYHPTPFHYAAAMRFDDQLVMGAIDSYLAETGEGLGGLMGGRATFCVQHPGTVARELRGESRVAKVYEGLGWGMIADSMPKPDLYLAMRGGNTTAEHCHVDLLSFRVLIDKEWLIENGRSGEYLHPTFFSPHRTEINDINATYKNTIFLNGIGPIPGSTTDLEEAVRGHGYYGLRMIASRAMAVDRGVFCGRLALMVDDSALLIVDRVETPELSRVESRMHSYQNVTFHKNDAMIKGAKACLRVTYASLEEAGLFPATTAPATPTNPSATMMRWCPLKRHKEAVLVALLTPGRARASAAVQRAGDGFLITLSIQDRPHSVRVRADLTLF